MQYRTWCKHCVAGAEIGQLHRTRTEGHRVKEVVRTIAVDYIVMLSEAERKIGRSRFCWRKTTGLNLLHPRLWPRKAPRRTQ